MKFVNNRYGLLFAPSDSVGSDVAGSDVAGSEAVINDAVESETAVSTGDFTVNGSELVASDAVKESGTVIDVSFLPKNFVKNLSYMGKGMLGIFVAITVIIVVTYIIAKACNKKGE